MFRSKAVRQKYVYSVMYAVAQVFALTESLLAEYSLFYQTAHLTKFVDDGLVLQSIQKGLSLF